MKKYAVAIDFGTSNSGAAYAKISDGIQARAEFLPYKGVNGIIPKVPTALLIAENLLNRFKSEGVSDTDVSNAISSVGNNDSLIYFGVLANRYRNKRGYCYFSELKMLLYNYKKTPNVMAVCTNTKKEYSLDLIIEIIYRVLKNKTLNVLQNLQGSPVSEDECVWGITTPAIWKRDGGAVNNRIVEIAHRVFRDERMLDEATASLYGALRQNILSGSCKIFKNYMIIDIGGGTTDIAVTSLVEEEDRHLAFEEKCPPSGCAQGGTDIDRRFWLFLVKRMIKGTSAELIYKNDHELLGRFIYAYVKENPKEFEINMRDEWLKMKLSLENRNEFRLPESFREWVSAVHNINVPKCIDFSVGEYNREVIDPCADIICGLISKIVENLSAQSISIDEVRLVGGGSLDNWLRQRIDMVLAKRLGKESIKQDNPVEALSAVLAGCAYQLISGNDIPIYKISSYNLYTVYVSLVDISTERENIKSYYKANFPKFNLSDENLNMLYSGQKNYLLPVVLKGQMIKNVEQPCCFLGRDLRDIFVRSDELVIGITDKNASKWQIVKGFSFKDEPILNKLSDLFSRTRRKYVYDISIGEQDFNIYTLRIKDPVTGEIKYTERINVSNYETKNKTGVQ